MYRPLKSLGMLRGSLLINIVHLVAGVLSSQHVDIDLSMPGVRPTHDETYLCRSRRLDLRQNDYVVAFEPNASATKVHHILIYGCGKPGIYLRDAPNYVWDCGEMSVDTNEESPHERGPVCAHGFKSEIIFAWALDAPSIELPPEVGFKIGGNSGINYLVLQVHYGHTQVFRDDPSAIDNSGIILKAIRDPGSGITKQAGIYLLLTYGYVVPGVSKHQMQCRIPEQKEIHPFRFRTHTHKLGTHVAGYLLPASDPSKPQLIGEHNPQEPQMFYPVSNPSMVISRGDQVYAFCDYNNTRGQTVYIGATGNDEMCNFYMMYWTEGELLKDQDCAVYNPN